eukprot:CAMPEP_0181115402 /NCGR_PEP_ID=MMETSP1071-20121207/21412_1 /TAXON_ID=35127 /ORGANISM="Thalassiosira sp., Strain NH16" /LENGTH=92 /DNA_ID=CAMNT_0023199605 /DNA_START=348 /DNA_END=624 /DNA_ORIENTATION=+
MAARLFDEYRAERMIPDNFGSSCCTDASAQDSLRTVAREPGSFVEEEEELVLLSTDRRLDWSPLRGRLFLLCWFPSSECLRRDEDDLRRSSL